jgi:hypothetical protein
MREVHKLSGRSYTAIGGEGGWRRVWQSEIGTTVLGEEFRGATVHTACNGRFTALLLVVTVLLAHTLVKYTIYFIG